MINKEKSLQEKNQNNHFEEWIHWITQINDSRLYWLWLKFVINAGATAGLSGFVNTLPVVNKMKPVTDVLSWSLFGGRFMVQSMWMIQGTIKNIEASPTHVTKLNCLTDVLWGTSNFLSAQWLHGNELRPSVGTPGWWGNLCMEVLLVYDVIFTAWQFRHEQLLSLEHETPILWQCRKQFLLSKLVYTTTLACGFLLFRGFTTQINNTVPADLGASLCTVSTILFRGIEWAAILSKLQKKQHLIMAHSVEALHFQPTFKQTCVSAGLSIGLDLFLPLYILLSSEANHMMLVIALSLSVNTLLSGCYKRDKISPLGRHSLFVPNRSPSVSPESIEETSLSLV